MKLLITSALTIGILVAPASALAQPSAPFSDLNSLFGFKTSKAAPSVLVAPKPTPKPASAEVVVAPPQPVVYSVVEGDNLSKIGTANNVEWQRLWAKNTQLTNPDIIHVGDQITIPTPDEVLARDVPIAVSLPVATPGVAPLVNYDVGSTAGNTYDYGYCTWFVKNKRGASIPNSLGNANTWYSRAYTQGMAVGSEPRPGAVATSTRGSLGHVAYVESVDGDKVTISEMNALAGWGKVNTRVVNASEFSYIY